MSDKMPPPGMSDKPVAGKAPPEEAMVIRADQHCIDCENYDPSSGECAKVEGNFGPQDGCVKYFDALKDEGSEPDSDEMGGAPDNDMPMGRQ